MKHCEIVRDLLPLYIEDMTSQGSGKFIRDHLAHCSSCKEEYERMTAPELPQTDPYEKWKIALQKEEKRQRRRKIITWALVLLVILCLIAPHLKRYLDTHRTTPQIITPIAPEEILKLCPTVVPTEAELRSLPWASTLPILTDTSRSISEEEFAPYRDEILPPDARIGAIDGWKQVFSIDYFLEGQRIMLVYRDADGNGSFDTLEKLVNPNYFNGEDNPFYSATYSTRTATTQYEMYE